MLERRSFVINELRIVENREKPTLSGHAAVFNQKSEEIFGFRELIRIGAFANTIKKDDIRALWNHDPNFVLGRRKNGTLELEEDDQGLQVRIHPPATSFASDLLETIKRGDVDQMSFGFRTITDDWRHEDGEVLRELVEVQLFDVSPVTFPAYPQTDISAREARAFFEARMKNIPAAKPPSKPLSETEIITIRTKHAAMRQKLTEKLWL